MDYCITGLGNVGEEYDLTPHNVGFMVCDEIASYFKSTLNLKLQFRGYWGKFTLDENRIFVLKPVTYVNLSGESVANFVRFYKINLANLIVVHDDINLPLSSMKIKFGSSSGGHRGVESIIERLSSKKFIQIKIGVGRSGDPRNYVLSKFGKKSLLIIDSVVERAKDACIDIVQNGLTHAMNAYNKKIGDLNER